MIPHDLCTDIPVLGKANITSPIKRVTRSTQRRHSFISDDSRIIVDVRTEYIQESVDTCEALLSLNRPVQRKIILIQQIEMCHRDLRRVVPGPQ